MCPFSPDKLHCGFCKIHCGELNDFEMGQTFVFVFVFTSLLLLYSFYGTFIFSSMEKIIVIEKINNLIINQSSNRVHLVFFSSTQKILVYQKPHQRKPSLPDSCQLTKPNLFNFFSDICTLKLTISFNELINSSCRNKLI